MFIKRERSPSPSVSDYPSLITSGSKLIKDVPAECRRGAPQAQELRKVWARTEVRQLRELGLKHTKLLFRDDGLVIDWVSPVPVWSDTLLPEAGDGTSSKASTSTAIAPRPDNSALGIDASNPAERASVTTPEPLPAKRPQQIGVEQGVLDAREKEAQRMEEMAVEFVQKYAKFFDTDRSALAGAYASNALFSYTIHYFIPPNSVAAAFIRNDEVDRFASRKQSRNLLNRSTEENIKQGREDIHAALQSLGPLKFSPDPSTPSDVSYHVVYRPSIRGVLLLCNGVLADGSGHRISFDMAFVLRRSTDRNVDRDNPGLWPLIAVNHQLTVRNCRVTPSPPSC